MSLQERTKLHGNDDFEAAEEILGYVQDNTVHCEETLFIALFQHYGKAHLVDKAVELFHSMTCFNRVRTRQSLNSLLNVHVDNDRFLFEKDEWEQACKVFEEMLETKVEPSVVTFNSLIGYLCRNGELDKAKGVLEDMIKKGKRPNAVTYALLMEGLCLIGEHDEAKKMTFDMEYRGCKPTVVNFGVLMTDLVKRGKIEEAKSLVHEMKKRHFN
ncbi:hypothetical protein POTOM_000160 [Populus tomentosa]|uniref:Pentatricopeptide repeat-containing protein n=1 Tax=Populus tomentosa TaxID=118781 RepID=A0A8X8AYW1_POPTO|nr:hypothetical protein POTOM_000160 [Populus tomentosa]